MKDNINNLFLKKGELTTKELINAGVSNYEIKKSVENKEIIRIKRGVYTLNNASLNIDAISEELCVAYKKYFKSLFPKIIKNFLKDINKEKYEYYVLKMFKILLVRGEVNKTNVSNLLRTVATLDESFNLENLLEYFNHSVVEHNAVEAKACYEVILHYFPIDTKMDNYLSSKLDEAINGIDYEKLKMHDSYLVEIITKATTDAKQNGVSIVYFNKNVGLEEYKEIIKRFGSFGVSLVNNHILIKKNNINTEYFDFKSFANKIKSIIELGKYNEAKDLLHQAIENSNPNKVYWWQYYYLGYVYYKLQEYEKASVYLDVIKLSIDNQYYGKALNLIEKIKKKTIKNQEQNEKNLNVCSEEFIKLFTDYIVLNNVNINDACSYFDLSIDETGMIKLKLAKEYYVEEFYEAGDRLVKQVESIKEKSDNLKQLLTKTKKKRAFYKNRSASIDVYTLGIRS